MFDSYSYLSINSYMSKQYNISDFTRRIGWSASMVCQWDREKKKGQEQK
jgi:hypothetical protein